MRFQLTMALLYLPVTARSDEQPETAKPDAAAAFEFEGEAYRLAWVHENRNGDHREIINEYVRTDETLENWNRLLSVRQYPHRRDYREMVGGLIKALRQHNPDAKFAIHENPERTKTMVDFLTWDLNSGITEFNVFIYQLGADDQSVVAQQFAMRAYGKDNGLEFMRQLKELRVPLLTEVSQFKFPAITTEQPKPAVAE